MQPITKLNGDQVFVFGSNAQGKHLGGAARQAWKRFGAVWGCGHGHHGQSYAIDTMSGPERFEAEVGEFIKYASAHPNLTFLVTEVGCGIAGYKPSSVAPWFSAAPGNVRLPESFKAESR